ncbi:MAG: glycoside hydrolase family 97 N-terminal domain-containing protein [Anaerolineae bacterium]|nr:glycoside hydrolase family 97 N-terminal domain-containing protein [Anaerolineae bacterium]
MSKNPPVVTQINQSYKIKSPDGHITVQVEAGDKLRWSVQHKGAPILKPSSVSLQLENGEVLVDHARVKSSEIRNVDRENSL